MSGSRSWLAGVVICACPSVPREPWGSWLKLPKASGTHLGIQHVRLASSRLQSIFGGLEVDGTGGVQGSLKDERRRAWK